ncbi:MAG: hypothetical protein H7Y32_02770, partial [Chloroflexales bacterium]|nr:hypothetical protein [Chloroflexales bacterium]
TCRVVCFSPRHDLTLAELPLGALRQVAACRAGRPSEGISNTYYR